MKQHTRHFHTLGFTLLEMVVVTIVIGVMATLILPRMSGNQDREFNLLVNRIGDMVLMFSHRVSTSNQPTGIRYNTTAGRVELLTKIEEDGEQIWDFDPLAEPIVLPSWIDKNALEIYVDGELSDTTQWPITTTPGETRPMIEVMLQWEERTAVISLSSHAMGPQIWLDGVGTEPLMPIDLDAQGRGREEW